ncbi:MAG: hypothetical protein KUA43_02800 [Hoeflea sp.]|uniref:hypothetical protein n=1 Tax=Hoeflea sp. TaxID=1940281 RepID=UPI001DB03399|nr:hypothetical protein [Hoeflea sp.]MBU4529858.1 hypothetical protein [Alphaproteobacteria bacterium]MBU4547121.1 hypothetical protein [Alphaproteobacteria bacterium]MBU4548734.1 hypothetical protein [Alphaproteobacteria bacterium]MBV1722351.1 hypothetical protein [Hoeflea sp.]MBV1781631.1 hypothetical protein [Hoeflea sp.]
MDLIAVKPQAGKLHGRLAQFWQSPGRPLKRHHDVPKHVSEGRAQMRHILAASQGKTVFA